MPEHDPVVDAAKAVSGEHAAEEMVAPVAATAPPAGAVSGSVIEGEPMPRPKSSLKILLPLLGLMLIAAIWGFMPMPLHPEIAKMGTVTDKGEFHEVLFKGDAYAAEQKLQQIFPELIAEKAKPDEGENQVAVYTDGKHFIDVVGQQGKEPAYIRVMKRKNLSRF